MVGTGNVLLVAFLVVIPVVFIVMTGTAAPDRERIHMTCTARSLLLETEKSYYKQTFIGEKVKVSQASFTAVGQL